MSDRDQFTATPISLNPDSWEAFAVFRETFLVNLSSEDAAAYRQMGRRLYLDRIEAFRLEDAPVGVTPAVPDLRAAAADLGILAGFLASMGEGSEPPASGASLTSLARECATVLVGLEHRLTAALRGLNRSIVPSSGDSP